MAWTSEQYNAFIAKKSAPKEVKKRVQHESLLQQQAVKWYDLTYPNDRLRLFSIPNEGQRSVANASRMKAQGRRAGVADMFFMTRYNSDDKGVYIEFKAGKGKQSESQVEFEKVVNECGYDYYVIDSLESFMKIIKRHY